MLSHSFSLHSALFPGWAEAPQILPCPQTRAHAAVPGWAGFCGRGRSEGRNGRCWQEQPGLLPLLLRLGQERAHGRADLQA